MSCKHCHTHEHSHAHEHSEKEKDERIVLYIRIAVSAILLIAALIIKSEAFKIILFLTSYFIVAYDVVVNAILNIFKGRFFDEAFLMSLATILAIVIKDYFEAVAVMLLYQIGEVFQDMAVDKSKESISKLLDNDIHTAILLENETEKEIAVEDIKVDDVIVIKSGQKIPVDGLIIEGSSSLNMSSLTGESLPRKVTVNDEVLSGSINTDKVIHIKVTKIYNESTAYKVAQVIKEASSNKANSEKFITKFSKYYTPIVILLAVIIATVIPLIVGWEHFDTYLHRALTFLVISCPCALVISIPLSFFAGIGKSAQKGVLVKGANCIESLSKVTEMAFDKTGTITKGNFEVVKFESNNDKLMLSLLMNVESKFDHPIAKSIVRYCKDKDYQEVKITDLCDISGSGVSAIYDDEIIFIGNERLMNANNITFTKCNEVGTIVYVAYGHQYLGYVLIEDEVKENGLESLDQLRKIGVNKMHLISGDNQQIVEKVAKKVNIDDYYYEMLPEDKVNVVKKIMNEKSKNDYLAYCGDGINDAAVLLQSDIGISMGNAGSDLTISASDVVLMNDNLANIEEGISTAKKTMKIVKQNIIFILAVKIIIMILGVFGYAPMLLAIFADVGISLLAVLNSLRVMYGKDKKKII